jgi:hypothetical protein
LNGSLVKRKLHIALFLIPASMLLIGWYWTVRVPLAHDPSKVDSALQSLVEPFQKVSVDFYPKSAAVGVAITDKNGKIGKYLMPSSTPDGAYHDVLAGICYEGEPGSISIPTPDDTRRRLTEIIAAYGDGGPDADMAIVHLRGAPTDRLFAWVRRTTGN